MRRFLVQLQYNGKAYCGWQRLEKFKTVQGEVEKALYLLLGKETTAEGCSRTDAGVSAKNYYFHFDAETKLPAERVCFKLNRFLPKDIQAQNSTEVPLSFHARKDVKQKTYAYRFYDGNHIKPLLNRDCYFVKGKLDIVKMNEACSFLTGRHNFAAFKTKSDSHASDEKTLYEVSVTEKSDFYELTLTGDGFLYNMVRIIAGTVIAVGKGEIQPEIIPEILERKSRDNAGITAPAKALTLEKVEYFAEFDKIGK